MAYAATAEDFPSSATSAPRVLALQRALVWLVGASGAIVFIEPSPYELMTLTAAVIFFATGLRLRLAFMPLLLLLFLLNVGYSIGAIPFMDKPEVANWIATSWYMAVTVMFFAMVVSEDTAARLDMLRRGLIVGALIASTSAIAGYFNLVPGGHDLLTLYERARGTFKDPNVLGAFLILPALFALQSVVSDRLRKIVPQRDRARHHGARDPAGVFARGMGRARPHLGLHAGADGADQPVARAALAHRRDVGRRRHRRGACCSPCCCRSTRSAKCSSSARASIKAMTRAASAGSDGIFSAREMALDLPFGIGPAAVPQLLSRGHPQFLSERLHVRRLDRRRLLSGAGVRHRHHGISPRLRPRALAARLSRDLRGVSRHGRRKLRHRHRPLAALLDDAGRDVGHVRRRATLQGDVRIDAPIGARRYRHARNLAGSTSRRRT